jgi:general secretion pathway protein E
MNNPQSITQFNKALATCMLADRHGLRRKIRDVADLQKALEKAPDAKSSQKVDRLLAEIVQKISSSHQKYQARLNALPKPEYELDLPVTARKDEIKSAIEKNQVVIVCGETGSGKTTTLYSSLKQLATEQVNVCTIEDPIEMLEPSFNQMQVNPTIELGFADGVRALMRQDPDIIMVGEIRDHDTANMAIQAALTGHLVLSTLHTNVAPSSLTRIHDLGVQPFLTAATILGVLAQRLVRRLCPQCKQETSMNEQEWEHLTFDYIMEMPETMYKAVGCETCRHTGYKGRVGIYEFMPVSLELKSLISAHGTLNDLKVQAKKEGVEPLRIAGARKVIEGVTTLEEVLRVVPLS